MAAALAGGRFYLCLVRGCGLLIIPCRFTGNIQDPDRVQKTSRRCRARPAVEAGENI
jgi:hypothetical protein